MASKSDEIQVDSLRIQFLDDGQFEHYERGDDIQIIRETDKKSSEEYLVVQIGRQTIIDEGLKDFQWLVDSSNNGIAALQSLKAKVVIRYDDRDRKQRSFFVDLEKALDKKRADTRPPTRTHNESPSQCHESPPGRRRESTPPRRTGSPPPRPSIRSTPLARPDESSTGRRRESTPPRRTGSPPPRPSIRSTPLARPDESSTGRRRESTPPRRTGSPPPRSSIRSPPPARPDESSPGRRRESTPPRRTGSPPPRSSIRSPLPARPDESSTGRRRELTPPRRKESPPGRRRESTPPRRKESPPGRRRESSPGREKQWTGDDLMDAISRGSRKDAELAAAFLARSRVDVPFELIGRQDQMKTRPKPNALQLKLRIEHHDSRDSVIKTIYVPRSMKLRSLKEQIENEANIRCEDQFWFADEKYLIQEDYVFGSNEPVVRPFRTTGSKTGQSEQAHSIQSGDTLVLYVASLPPMKC